MGIDSTEGGVFMRRKGRLIRYLERHEGIPMDFWYLDTETGIEFDIRRFTEDMRGKVPEADILHGDREAHRKAIRHALDAGMSLRPPRET